MPTYEYACDKCGHEFEREQRITEDPVRTCPECRARKVRRLISNTSFVLKGSGWYSDLYSSAQPDKPDKPEKVEKDESGKAGTEKKGGESKAAEGSKEVSSKPSKTEPKPSKPKKKASG